MYVELKILTPQHGTARTVLSSFATGQSLLDLASGFLHNLPTPPERLASSRTRPQYLSQNNSDHSHLALDILSAFPPTANHGIHTSHRLQARKKQLLVRKSLQRHERHTAVRVSCSCTARCSCKLPSHRLLHPPEHLHMYVHMQCRDLDCQGQRGVPPCPRLPRLSLLPSSLKFDMLWNLDPCPSSTTES